MHIKMEMTSTLIGLLNQQRKKSRKSTETKEIFIKPIYKCHITFEFYQLLPRYILPGEWSFDQLNKCCVGVMCPSYPFSCPTG